MDNACVVGYGTVGKATASLFGIDKHYDLLPERSNITFEQVVECKYIFICLPTEVIPNGPYDTSSISSFIEKVRSVSLDPIYIIRSTVYPGFAFDMKENLKVDKIVSNPEFLNEATAELDAKNPPFILLGGEDPYIEKIKGFYQARIKSAPVITTDSITAEMAKLTMNAYFATKVIFANQAYDSCAVLGANYDVVKKVLESHPYGPNNHFTVWFRGKRGVHGKCLPKDSSAFAYYTRSELVNKVVELNRLYKDQRSEDAS